MIVPITTLAECVTYGKTETELGEEGKEQLERMLQSFTSGSILHLLAELYQQAADDARNADDAQAYQQAKLVESTLIVVGIGIDAASPR